MKIAIVIPTYNRPQYLERCLASLKRSNLMGADIIIADDYSDNERTKELIKDYHVFQWLENVGICRNLNEAIQYCFNKRYDIVINLDSDAIVRNDWLEVLLHLHKQFTDKIITGFHSTTKNKDGSERHKMIRGGTFTANNGYVHMTDKSNEPVQDKIAIGWCEKLSVGGINMLFTKETFTKYAKPALEKCIKHGGNWDHQTCINAGSVICAVPSVVQHIGIESSLGHTHDAPDVADDFKMLHLPNVTLVCVDDNRTDRVMQAANHCLRDIRFADIKLIEPNPKLGSKEAYSKFILTELYKYVETDYALIIQHDGYVKNPEAWSDEFLNYDYIGAPWWYTDGMNVGNGGFSLRSKKLLKMTAEMNFKQTHPEDHVICRTYRKELEAKGIKFAPEELASKFSFEGYKQPGTWSGQFGFHGQRAFRRPPDPNKPGFIINQFFGLGDILFLVPLIRKWMAAGHDIIWPIADQYFGIKQNFHDIQFVPLSKFPFANHIPHEFYHHWQYGRYLVKPLRWNKCLNVRDCMTTKYTMYGEDWQMWRQLTWERNYEKEKKLADLVGAREITIETFCGIEHIPYELNFKKYGSIPDGPCEREVGTSDYKIINVEPIEHYTLLDWCSIIENASAIHAVSSACIYLFELLNLKCEVNLYARKQGMRDFTYIEKLLTKKYHFHI